MASQEDQREALAYRRSGPTSFISHNNEAACLRGSFVSFLSVILQKKKRKKPAKDSRPALELIGVPILIETGVIGK